MKKKFSVRLMLVFVLIFSLLITGCSKPAENTQPGGSTEVEKIVIGVPSGLGQIESRDNLKAIELAVAEINESGGVEVGGKKHIIEVYSIDTREAEPGVPIHDSLAAVEKLINEKKPHAIVKGAMRSEVLLASMDLVANYKIPYIGSQAMSDEMQKKVLADYEKYKYFFRVSTNGGGLVGPLIAGIQYIGDEFGFDKIYFMPQDMPWATGIANAVSAAAEKSGWTVVGFDAYPTGASDFSSSLSRAKSAGAQVIVPIYDSPQAGTLVKQANAMEVPALIAGYMAPITTSDAWDNFDGEIDGAVALLFDSGPIPIRALEKSVNFTESYARKYGEEALEKATAAGFGASYDAVYVLVEAIKRADSLDADAIVEELEKTDYNGVIGRIRFNEGHQAIFGDNPAETAIGLLFQWIDGKRVVVYPEAVAETKIQLPGK